LKEKTRFEQKARTGTKEISCELTGLAGMRVRQVRSGGASKRRPGRLGPELRLLTLARQKLRGRHPLPAGTAPGRPARRRNRPGSGPAGPPEPAGYRHSPEQFSH
jgi:hypothetical protein